MVVFKIDPPNTGRLGNQLFQIAATLSHAANVGDKAQFTNWEYNKYFINPIDDNLDTTYDCKFANIMHNPLLALQFEYKPLPPEKNVILHGFFQSEKYFIDNIDLIINHFKPKNEFLRVVRDAGAEFLNLQNTVAMHVRRGDYLSKPDCHPALSETDYYQKAILEICKYNDFELPLKSRINFVVFSDDIAWCKANLSVPNDITTMHFVEGNSDIVDLFLMAQCKNHIIANSSFSWWAAWLAKNLFFGNHYGLTIAPKTWFGPSLSHYNTTDLLPSDWIKL